MAFHPIEIETLEEKAASLLSEFDIGFFIEAYASSPDLAGAQMQNIIDALPSAPESKNREKVDAFIGWKILTTTHEQVMRVFGDDEEMRKMLADVGPDPDISESIKSDDPMDSQSFRKYLRDQSKGDQGAVEDAIRRETGDADKNTSESFQDSLRENRGDQEERAPDFSIMSPQMTFRQSTLALGQTIIRKATEKSRLKPLVANAYVTNLQVMKTCGEIMRMIHQLRLPEDPDQFEGHDD